MNSKSLFMKVHEENSIPIMPFFFFAWFDRQAEYFKKIIFVFVFGTL